MGCSRSAMMTKANRKGPGRRSLEIMFMSLIPIQRITRDCHNSWDESQQQGNIAKRQTGLVVKTVVTSCLCYLRHRCLCWQKHMYLLCQYPPKTKHEHAKDSSKRLGMIPMQRTCGDVFRMSNTQMARPSPTLFLFAQGFWQTFLAAKQAARHALFFPKGFAGCVKPKATTPSQKRQRAFF